MPGVLTAVLGFALVASFALLVAGQVRVRTFPELLLTAYVVGYAGVVALMLFLSPFAGATRSGLVLGALALVIAAGGVALMRGDAGRLPRWPRDADTVFRTGPVILLSVAVALSFTYVGVLILGTPPNGWDPLNYHLTRAALWVQAGGVEYVSAAYDERLNFNPPHAEIGVAFALAMAGREELSAAIQFLATIASAVGVFALGRRFGLARAEAACGGLLFALMPIVLLQSSTAKNDVVVASFLVAAAVFVLRDTTRELVVAGTATALATGTKFTAAYGLVVLVALALATGHMRVRRLLALGAGAVLGSYWYIVNLLETDRLLGDQANVPGLTAVLSPRENLVTAVGIAVDTLDLSGAVGSDLYVFVILAGALVGSLAVFARGRVSRQEMILAGAIVAAPIVLYPIATKIGRPSLTWVYDALGSPQAYLAVGDAVASSPTTASDTASWFGPAGLLLTAGTAVVACFLVRRRSLPRIALVPALAPLLWFLLVAGTLTYHPWQGRFFVFPIALSASLWGLMLRSQPVAWAITVLAGTTAALSLVHFAEKPSGVALLERDAPPSVWQAPRSTVQSSHDPSLEPILAFLDREVPEDATVGLALGANEFGFPAFGASLGRTVELIPFGSPAGDLPAEWLYANPERARAIDRACWRDAFVTDRGSVLRRTCP